MDDGEKIRDQMVRAHLMNQCRSELEEASTVHFRCQHQTGHAGEHKYFVPEDEDLLRKDRDNLLLQNDGMKKLLAVMLGARVFDLCGSIGRQWAAEAEGYIGKQEVK